MNRPIKSMRLLMWTQVDVKRSLVLRLHTFVWSCILYRCTLRVIYGIWCSDFSMLIIFHIISHKKTSMVCQTFTHSLSLNPLTDITAADAFHSRRNCNTRVINRHCTWRLSSFELPYWRVFIAIKLYQTLLNQYNHTVNSHGTNLLMFWWVKFWPSSAH